MRKNRLFWLGTALVAVVASLAVAQEKSTAPAKALKPYVTWWGGESAAPAEYARASTRDEFVALWLKNIGHKGAYDSFYNQPPIPDVDFDACTVVAIFLGEQTNSAGVYAFEVADLGGQVRLRFREQTYQTAGPGPRGGGQRRHPWGIFALPKTTLPIVLEEDRQHLIGGPPIWKQVAVLK